MKTPMASIAMITDSSICLIKACLWETPIVNRTRFSPSRENRLRYVLLVTARTVLNSRAVRSTE